MQGARRWAEARAEWPRWAPRRTPDEMCLRAQAKQMNGTTVLNPMMARYRYDFGRVR